MQSSRAHAKTLRRKEDAKDREKGSYPQASVPSVPLCFLSSDPFQNPLLKHRLCTKVGKRVGFGKRIFWNVGQLKMEMRGLSPVSTSGSTVIDPLGVCFINLTGQA